MPEPLGVEQLFPGSGELVELCRRTDWSSTALGPVELWPSALRHAVKNLLAQPFASLVLWGPERILMYNDAFRPVLGDEHPRAFARSLGSVVPDVAAMLGPVVARVMAGESVCIEDARWDTTRYGAAAAAWFTLSGLPLRDDAGRVAGVLATAIETTTRKKAEEALRRSDERRAFLLELSDALSVPVDPVTIQDVACRLLGEKLQCDRTYYCYFDEVAGYAEVPREHLRNGAPSLVGRYPLAAFDWVSTAFRLGKRLAFDDTRTSPLIPEHRRAAMAEIQMAAFIVAPLVRKDRLRVGLVVTDVTPRAWTSDEAELVQDVAERTWAAVERALAEAALAAELAATKVLQQLSTELIPNQGPAIYDKLLDAAMQLMGAHAASLQRLDPDADHLELLASRNFHALSTAYWSIVEAGSSSACGRALARGERVLAADVERTEFFADTPDLDELRRSNLRAVLSTPLVARSGQTVGMLSVHWRQVHQPSERDFNVFDVLARQVADLLERGEAEAKAREARAQAESANRSKDEFLATLSHELRTPLAAILLWAGALRSGAVPLHDLERAIDAIVKSAESQSRLIEDLLDLSRLASGKLALTRTVVDVRACAQAALEMLKPIAGTKNIGLEWDMTRECSAVLDGTRLQQILWNLLSNATKFTPAGGTVRLRVDAGARGIELVVSDTGEGIAPEFLPRLFDKFSQYDMGETRQHMGLGIGLSLTRQLVELHGGTIEAESAGLGRGALFRVRLPWLRPSEHRDAGALAHRAAGFAPSPLSSLRVLLVEDDSLTREAMRWTLSRAGALVVDVATADEALLAVGDGDGVDVIVSDLGLPTTSGLELIERIGKGARERGRPVPPSCAVSAHARDVDRRRAIDAGFDLYITKPVSPDCLIEAVSDLREILARADSIPPPPSTRPAGL